VSRGGGGGGDGDGGGSGSEWRERIGTKQEKRSLKVREGKGICRALAIGQFSGREPRPGRPSKKKKHDGGT
jgi:hypothetical protein